MGGRGWHRDTSREGSLGSRTPRHRPVSPQLSLRVKALKRQVDEAEEEIERLEGARKKAQRELEEQHELNEQLQNRVKALEKEAW